MRCANGGNGGGCHSKFNSVEPYFIYDFWITALSRDFEE